LKKLISNTYLWLIKRYVLFLLHVYWPQVWELLIFANTKIVRSNIIYTKNKKREKATGKRNWRIYCWGVHFDCPPKEWLRVTEKRILVKREFKMPSFPNDHTHVLCRGKEPLSLSVSIYDNCVREPLTNFNIKDGKT